jgi:hypothetical protein
MAETLTAERSIEIARRAIAGKVELSPDSSVEVASRKGLHIVTFVHHTPPHMLGPDYDARVTIDASTGEVLEILGAP